MTGSGPVSPQPSANSPEVAFKVAEGDSPMDFITKNLRRPAEPAPAATPQPVASEPPKETTPEPTFNPPDLPIEPPKEPNPKPPEPKKEEPLAEPLVEPDKDKNLLSKTFPKEKGDSVKDLRRKTQELETTLSEKDQTLKETQEKLSKYESGEAVPEVVQQLNDRIAELEHFEKLHSFRTSKEYHEKFAKPVDELRARAVKLAEEYEVDPAILAEAYNLQNKKDLNVFLRQHFDDVGAMEVRDVLLNIKNLQVEAESAIKEPAKKLEEIILENRKRDQVKQTERVNVINSNAREGWVSALTELRASGKYPEIVLTGDPNHDKISRPLLNEASSEVGKFVKAMGMHGLSDLPIDAAKILSKMALLARIADVAAAERDMHYRRAEEIKANSERVSTLSRPALGQQAPLPPVSERNSSTPHENLRKGIDGILETTKNKLRNK